MPKISAFAVYSYDGSEDEVKIFDHRADAENLFWEKNALVLNLELEACRLLPAPRLRGRAKLLDRIRQGKVKPIKSDWLHACSIERDVYKKFLTEQAIDGATEIVIQKVKRTIFVHEKNTTRRLSLVDSKMVLVRIPRQYWRRY